MYAHRKFSLKTAASRARLTGLWQDRKIRRVLLGLGLAGVLVYLVGGDYGFFKQVRLWMESKSRTVELKHQEMAADSLRTIRKRLVQDTAFIEKMAREKLGMVRSDETVFKFIDTTGRGKNADE